MTTEPDMVRELASLIANAMPDAFAHTGRRIETAEFNLDSDFSDEERLRFERLAAEVIAFVTERTSHQPS